MKSEPKAFASLSSGLLARKGAARPAMRPQGFGQIAAGLEDLGWNDMGFDPPKPTAAPTGDAVSAGETVAEHPARHASIGLTPVHSPVHDQQAEIAGRLATSDADEEAEDDEAGFEIEDTARLCEPEAAGLAPEPAVAPVAAAPNRLHRPRAAAGSKSRAAFTLRLDPERHLKLRLACAVSLRSAQQLVTDALDSLLAGMPELDAMAARAKRKG